MSLAFASLVRSAAFGMIFIGRTILAMARRFLLVQGCAGRSEENTRNEMQ